MSRYLYKCFDMFIEHYLGKSTHPYRFIVAVYVEPEGKRLVQKDLNSEKPLTWDLGSSSKEEPPELLELIDWLSKRGRSKGFPPSCWALPEKYAMEFKLRWYR